MADSRLIDLSGVPTDDAEDEAAFYFDIGDPECWLAAERVIQTLGRPAPWVPVLTGAKDSGGRDGTAPPAPPAPGGDARRPGSRAGFPRAGEPNGRGHAGAESLTHADVERIAAERGLLAFKPPEAPQSGIREVALAATYAKQAGKVVAFTLAAMRQCWCGGRDLNDRSTLLLAGAAAEIHPNALEKAFELKSLNAELDRQLERAAAYGIDRVPAVRVGRKVYFGDGGIDEAAMK